MKELTPNQSIFADIYDNNFVSESSIDFIGTYATENKSLVCSLEDNLVNKSDRFKKKAYCFFCNNLVSNFARHLRRNHYEESEVKQCFVNRAGSQKRKHMLKLLRNKGNFIKKSKRVNKPHTNFLPCIHCLGYFGKKSLARHVRQCFANTEQNNNKNNNKNCLSQAQNILLRRRKIHESLINTVFLRMRADSISFVAKQDELICAYGARYLRMHCTKHMINSVSNRMRNLAKLLIEISKINPKIQNLFQVLHPEHYSIIVEATKIVAKFNPVENVYQSPSYAINIVTSLKQCCELAIIYARKRQHFLACTETEVNLQKMIELLRSDWKHHVISFDDINLKKSKKEANRSLDENTTLDCKTEVAVNKIVSSNTIQPQISTRKRNRRLLIPWTPEQKIIVNEYFKQHILIKKPPKRHECETLIKNNLKLLENKNWLKIKVYIQNKYTKKYK